MHYFEGRGEGGEVGVDDRWYMGVGVGRGEFGGGLSRGGRRGGCRGWVGEGMMDYVEGGGEGEGRRMSGCREGIEGG